MELAAAAGAAAGSLFGYNRENYFFDGEQRIKREYQGQMMRVKQFELFREDIRDLMNLTVGKMDNYLIVNTIQIGLVVVLFTEGRPEPGVAPPWLLCLWGASGAGSFMYITLCIWLAMHASICSHSFCVRMLTQVVRLPIPTKEQLDAARVMATDFEGTKVREMLRVPVVKQQLKRLQTMVDQMDDHDPDLARFTNDAGSDGEAEETMLDADGRPVATDTLAHVRLYRKMQANWQAYDAYARVSMAMGTNQFLQQLGYTCLIGFISENKSILPGICSVVIFSVCAALLVRLDLYLPFRSLMLAGLLNTLPPMIAGISLIMNLAAKDHDDKFYKLLGDAIVPSAFFLHILWLLLLLRWAKGKKINNLILPTTFRAVLYLDVFGWLSSPQNSQVEVAVSREPQADAAAAHASFGLSVLREEEAWQPSPSRPNVPFAPTAAPADGDCQCRQSLRDSLAKLCAEMRRELEMDLGSFEAEDVNSLMENYEKQVVIELRKQLKEIVGNLSFEAPGISSSHTSDTPVWVRLDWNPSGRAVHFFRRVRSEDTSVVWTRPMPPDIILELDEIRQRLESFKMKVQTLVSQFSMEVGERLDSPSRDGSNASAGSGEASEASAHMWHVSDPAHGDPSQLGSESVQLAEAARMQDPNGQQDLSAEAAGGFHPHQPRSQEERDSRRGEPGQLPWDTVKQGSLILIGTWCIAFVWSILRLWIDLVDILEPPNQPPDLEMLYDGPWPRFFDPTGLACHVRGAQERLLIAEKHDVHELVQGEKWNLMRSFQEAHCLSNAPEFQAAGLRGISLDCAEEEACASILVGEGNTMLQCQQNSSRQWHVFGGPWHVASTRDPEGFWAQRAVEKSPVLLSSRGAAGNELHGTHFVPSMQLGPHPAAAQQEFLDTLQGGGLLALSQQGRLHAWQPSHDTGTSERWQPSGWTRDLPKELGLRWLGMCAAGNSAFLLGKGPKGPKSSGRVELWKVKLASLLSQ